jgi:hypothetical protein
MKGIPRAVTVLAAAACGVYTLVYLYRWEWHRAILAAVFLVVAEVALATVAVLRRLAVLDRRLSGLAETVEAGGRTQPGGRTEVDARPRPDPEILARLRDAAAERRPPFAWLEPDRLGVFLPILLGAGLLASAAAWAVEGLARATAQPALEHRLAVRLGVFALPAGGLLGAGPAAPVPPARRAPGRAARVVLMTVAVFGGALGIDELADATQTRPDRVRSGVHTIVELDLHGELAEATPARAAAALWHSCVGTLQRDVPEPVVTDLGRARVRLALPFDLGAHAARRLHGCLEDAGVDRVQAGVTLRAVSAAP